jgi:signal transduction histidine kinase
MISLHPSQKVILWSAKVPSFGSNRHLAFSPADVWRCMQEQPTYHELEKRLLMAAEALRRAEEQATAGRLALELMHEVKNPLETLGHLVYLARHASKDFEQVEKYMDLAEEQMRTVTEITSQTLSFAQVLKSPKLFDLMLIAEAALRIHQRTIDAKKVRVLKDLHLGAIVPVHKGEILQVVSNIIVNALDALPETGTLSLKLRKRASNVDLFIADSGCGISLEHRELLFQPFFTTKEERGTGLGLALSRKIIERHHGLLSMRSSVRPGKSGTTFRISLPC